MECNGNHKKLCILSDCKKCFERSFASHEKSTFMMRMLWIGWRSWRTDWWRGNAKNCECWKMDYTRKWWHTVYSGLWVFSWIVWWVWSRKYSDISDVLRKSVQIIYMEKKFLVEQLINHWFKFSWSFLGILRRPSFGNFQFIFLGVL